MKPFRQGDVILIPGVSTPLETFHKLEHLVLAEGEVTGHAHQISAGDAELYEKEGTLYLRVLSDTALITHEEHQPISLPKGDWTVRIQREYEPAGWRYVAD